ncbi:MAG TPA: tetratricopeptide repeat protein [Flavobacteriales bacterium]|nr:tetratricopeptide repeat protein [Flavobacteriales bacterium]
MHFKFTYIILLALLLHACSSLRKEVSTKSNEESKVLVGQDLIRFQKLFYNANREKVLGNLDKAANLFESCIRKDPGSAAAMYELGGIYVRTGKLKEGVYFAKQAAEIDRKNVWYQLLLADAYAQSGKYDKSIKTYQEIIKLHPEKIELYYEMSSIMLTAKQFTEAIEVYNQIEEIIGVAEDVSLQKEMIYIKLNKIDKAALELEKLIAKNPKEVRFYGMLAELYQANNMPEKALETYERLKAEDPDDPHIHLSLSNYYRSIGDREKSYSELKLAFSNERLDINKKINILLSYYSITQSFPELTDQALTLCKLLVKTHPEEAKSHSMYGDFLYRENLIAESREEYRAALKLDANRFAIWQQLLQINSQLNDYDALLEESAKALELFPNQSILYLYNGIANIQRKTFDDAIEVLQKGIELTTENRILLSNFYSSLGDSYHSNKDTIKSDKAYDKALEFDPVNKYVLNNYSYYLSQRGTDLERAKNMSESANKLDPDNSSFQDTYAWILYKSKQYEEAKKWLEKALEGGGKERSAILEHYGDVLFKLGEVDNAVEYWKKAKEHGNKSDKLEKKIADRFLYE